MHTPITLKKIKAERLDRIESVIYEAIMDIKGLVLAGGAVRDALFNKKISDYDMFLFQGGDVEKAKSYFDNNGFTCTFACPLGHLFSFMKGEDFKKPDECIKVQIIHKRKYRDMQDLINSFDFSVTYFGMEYDEETDDFYVTTDWQAIKDVRKMQISLVNLEYPSSTINRLYKYRQKGYYTGHVIQEIVKAVALMTDYDAENDTLYVD